MEPSFLRFSLGQTFALRKIRLPRACPIRTTLSRLIGNNLCCGSCEVGEGGELQIKRANRNLVSTPHKQALPRSCILSLCKSRWTRYERKQGVGGGRVARPNENRAHAYGRTRISDISIGENIAITRVFRFVGKISDSDSTGHVCLAVIRHPSRNLPAISSCFLRKYSF